MEEAKKKKKNVECMQCLQKDAEIKGLFAKVDKVLLFFLIFIAFSRPSASLVGIREAN